MSDNNGAGRGAHTGDSGASREMTLDEVVMQLPIGHRARTELAGLLRMRLAQQHQRLDELNDRLNLVMPIRPIDEPGRAFAPDGPAGPAPGAAFPQFRPPTPFEEQAREGGAVGGGMPDPRFDLRARAAQSAPGKDAGLFKPHGATTEGILDAMRAVDRDEQISKAIAGAMDEFAARYSVLSRHELQTMIEHAVKSVLRRG